MTGDDDAEVRKMAAAKGLKMREIDFFDGEFEEQSYMVVAPRPVWDHRVVAIGTAGAIREYLESDWCANDVAMLADPDIVGRGQLRPIHGTMTRMVRLNQISRDDGVPPTLNLVMDCEDRIRINIALTADQAAWIRDRLTQRLRDADEDEDDDQ